MAPLLGSLPYLSLSHQGGLILFLVTICDDNSVLFPYDDLLSFIFLGEEVELANGILYTVTATNISINRPQFNDGNVYIEILNSGEFGAISYWYWPDLVVYNLTAATSYDFIFGFFYTLYWSFCYIGSAKFSTACTGKASFRSVINPFELPLYSQINVLCSEIKS